MATALPPDYRIDGVTFFSAWLETCQWKPATLTVLPVMISFRSYSSARPLRVATHASKSAWR
jgi:hypothetical protein